MIKQARVVPLETPDNSSDSDNESENEDGKEIQVNAYLPILVERQTLDEQANPETGKL